MSWEKHSIKQEDQSFTQFAIGVSKKFGNGVPVSETLGELQGILRINGSRLLIYFNSK